MNDQPETTVTLSPLAVAFLKALIEDDNEARILASRIARLFPPKEGYEPLHEMTLTEAVEVAAAFMFAAMRGAQTQEAALAARIMPEMDDKGREKVMAEIRGRVRTKDKPDFLGGKLTYPVVLD